MNLLSWMMLVFLLSAGTSEAAVDVNWLTRIVNAIRGEYKIEEQFCLAANIPLKQDPNRLHEVLQNDRYSGNVDNTLDGCMVYEGSNVVAAKHIENQHAEPLVLKNLQPLIRNNEGNFLLIYSFLSPCGDKCTNPENKRSNILKYFKNFPNKKDYAFVFTKVFDEPKGSPVIPREELIESLKQLGKSGLGLKNIFRCYEPNKSELQCYSCYSEECEEGVSEVCVDNKFVPQQGGSSSMINRGNRGRDEGRSRSRSRNRGVGGRNRDRDKGRSRSRSRNRGVGGRNRDRDKGRNRSRSRNRGVGGRNRDRDKGRNRSRSNSHG